MKVDYINILGAVLVIFSLLYCKMKDVDVCTPKSQYVTVSVDLETDDSNSKEIIKSLPTTIRP